MKAMLLSLALLLAASAASGQAVDSSVVCAVHKLTAMGYTIESANKDFGLVKATKKNEGFVTTINVAQHSADSLAVTVKLENEDRNWRTGTVRMQDLGEGTKYTKADAQAIRDACSSK
jgi:hypothetical protein